MIYDVIPFLNETELLEIRLHELQDVVDQFVIVEAPLTYKGDVKPLYYYDQRSKFSQWSDKIKHVIVKDMPTAPSGPTETDGNDPAWLREIHQRKAGLAAINPKDDDTVVLLDCDEIPRAAVVRDFNPRRDEAIAILMPQFVYYLNIKITLGDDINANIMSGRVAKTCRTLRGWDGTWTRREIKDGGWHFTKMGGIKKAASSVQASAHWNGSAVPSLIEDILNDRHIEREGPRLTKVPIDGTFPKYVVDNIPLMNVMGLLHQPLL